MRFILKTGLLALTAVAMPLAVQDSIPDRNDGY